ncbi:hypothetical protein FQN51_007914 [Onygenales sp. PD_10]|nr:hypothetical protein FQN51_007914 [Onygenales sp. PD_10]
MITLLNIGQERAEIFKRVLTSILQHDLVKTVFAQVIDGIPIASAYESTLTARTELTSRTDPSHQSVLLSGQLCESEGILDTLELNPTVAQLYQDSPLMSSSFNMHLLELVAIAVHNLAGNLYLKFHPDGATQVLEPNDDPYFKREYISLSTMFYCDPSRFPRAFLDVVGCWAEVQIFGGVVVFDRGLAEGERHCHGAYIHPRFPELLFELSESQLEGLSNLGRLTLHVKDSPPPPFPLPFTCEPHARTVDHASAFLHLNIYRDRDERFVRPPASWVRCSYGRTREQDVKEMEALWAAVGKYEPEEQNG